MNAQILVTHLRYHRWATEQVLKQVQELDAERQMKNLGGSFGTIYGAVAHLYQADSVWLDRLEGRSSGPAERYEAPGCTYDLGDVWLKALDRMIQLAEGLSEEKWNEVVAYKTMAGVPYQNSYLQIVLHVVNHGTHHRGQVVHMFRQLGLKPVNLDLIAFYRAHPALAEAGVAQLQA